MNKIIITLTAAAALVLGATACNKNLVHGVTDLTLPEETVEPVAVTFSHPGAYVNADDLSRVRSAVAAADPSNPVYAAWLQLCNNPWAQETVAPEVLETVVRGDPAGTGVDKENYIVCDRQAAAAFQLALRWQVSGEAKYAEAARTILNAWAAGCKKIASNDANQMLLAGFQGHTFANAAELLRGYEGWTASEQNAFKDWLKGLWYAKNYDFIETHGGSNVCDLHYWSNWELANLASILAIGIYLEDEEMVNYVNKQWLTGKGSGAIKNFVPYDPVADPSGHGVIAQGMESGRDQGHATLCVSVAAELCRMAQNVGLDFWGTENSRVLAYFEYTAKYNVRPDGNFITTSMPFTRYEYCPDGCGCANHSHGSTHTAVSSDGRGTIRPGWDLIYAHYVKETGKEAYYTKLFAQQLRYTNGALTGDGGAGDSRYGANSSAYDQIGWGTLLFYQGE